MSNGTSIELFSGGGGLAMALHDAGFRHLLVNERDKRACASLRSNRAVDLVPDEARPATLSDPWPLIEGSVFGVDFTPYAGDVDIVAGGVPCQPFSLGGAHKGHLDERNLWPEFNRCVRETRPKVIVAENVRGLLRPSFSPYWDYIRRESVPVNPLHELGFASIGCAPCTRPIAAGQPEREGRWWWEAESKKECGLHNRPGFETLAASSPAPSALHG